MPCPQGYYCPSQERMQICPGIVTFVRGGVAVTVPTTDTAVAGGAAYKLQQCNCSAAGGFEPSRSSQALFGCVACADGHFSSPGMRECQPCPAGSFAARQSVCPVSSRACTNATMVDVGAATCTVCPRERPYTRSAGMARGVQDCFRCPEDHYYSSEVGCVLCSPPCKRPGFYESLHCTESSNRQCAVCHVDRCNPLLGEYLEEERGCPGEIDDDRACSMCDNDPERRKPANSSYTAPLDGNVVSKFAMQCQWQCTDGFFNRPGESGGVCTPCTVLTDKTCKPGFEMVPCSSLQNMDATCSRECDPEAVGKPPHNSEWVWTTLSGATLIENPTGFGVDGKPNVGCMWRCKDGYAPVQLDAGEGTGVIDSSDTAMKKITLCAKRSY